LSNHLGILFGRRTLSRVLGALHKTVWAMQRR